MPTLATTLFITIALIFGLLAGWSLARLHEHMARYEKRLSDLEKVVDRRKLPYPAMCGLEDATAKLMRSHRDFETAATFIAQAQKDAERAAEIIKIVRGDPHQYSPDTPAEP